MSNLEESVMPVEGIALERKRLMRPLTLVLLSLLTGGAGAAVFAAHTCWKLGLSLRAFLLFALAPLLLVAQLHLIWSLNLSAIVTRGTFITSSLIMGVLFSLSYLFHYQEHVKAVPRRERSPWRGTWMLVGIVGGGFSGFVLLFLFGIFLSIFLDFLLSTLLPINYSLGETLKAILVFGGLGALSGMRWEHRWRANATRRSRRPTAPRV